MAVTVIRQLTLQQLRGILSEQIEKIREGQATAANVNAISNATGKILSSVKLELEYHKLTGKTPNIPELLTDGGHGQQSLPDQQ